MMKQKGKEVVLSFLSASNSIFFCTDATHNSALLNLVYHSHPYCIMLSHPCAQASHISEKIADLLYVLAGDAEKYSAFIAPEAYRTLSS
jgi:hypothetical protein